MKQELTKLEKSYLMARLEMFLKERDLEELIHLADLAQQKAFFNPELKYLSEVWGMIELERIKRNVELRH